MCGLRIPTQRYPKTYSNQPELVEVKMTITTSVALSRAASRSYPLDGSLFTHRGPTDNWGRKNLAYAEDISSVYEALS